MLSKQCRHFLLKTYITNIFSRVAKNRDAMNYSPPYTEAALFWSEMMTPGKNYVKKT